MCCLIRVNLELFVVVNVTRGTDEERQMKGMFAANGLREMGEITQSRAFPISHQTFLGTAKGAQKRGLRIEVLRTLFF